MTTWHILKDLLLPRERRVALLLMWLMLLQAIIETAGVASILPLLAVLGSPDIITRNPALQWAFTVVNADSVEQFQLYLSLASFSAIVFGAVIRVLTEYAIARFAELRRLSMSGRLLARYLRQPYVFFLHRNSADLSRTMLSEVDVVVQNVVIPALRIPVYGFLSIALVVLLVFTDPIAASVAAVAVTGAYWCLYAAISGLIRRSGDSRAAANRLRFSIVTEALGGIKAIKLQGSEQEYMRRFHTPAVQVSRQMAFVRVVSTVPRYAMEVCAVGGILTLTLARLAQGMTFEQIVPLLGLYAFAGYRLIPAVQHVYSSLATLKFGLPAARSVLADLQGDPGEDLADASLGADMAPPLRRLTEGITFRHVTFRYPGADRNSVTDLTITVPAGRIVAVVGETGAGKSTMIDLLLGLLTPTDGDIAIDGAVLTGARLTAWQHGVGYVPQQVFLTDDTVLANIAFGVPPDKRDAAAAERAARAANLHDAITGWTNGYTTKVGERGVRLSGGERQRLGVARALYNEPGVLVLDEPTAGLDADVERQLLISLFALAPQTTIVLITHSEKNLEGVDLIVRLERGRIHC